MLSHPYSKEFLPYVQVEPPVFQFLPIASHLVQIDIFVLNSCTKRQIDTTFLNAAERLCDGTEEPSGSWHLMRY